MRQLTGTSQTITRRTDGKPDQIQEQSVSLSHCDNLTLAISGQTLVACDLEIVSSTSYSWSDLLGIEGAELSRLITHETTEPLEIAATRIWAAQECLKKAGMNAKQTPIVLKRLTGNLIWLQAGGMVTGAEQTHLMIATWALTVNELKSPLVIAILSAVPSPMPLCASS